MMMAFHVGTWAATTTAVDVDVGDVRAERTQVGSDPGQFSVEQICGNVA
jgi:hypothetical protein